MTEQEQMMWVEQVAKDMGYKNLDEMIQSEAIINAEGNPLHKADFPEQLSKALSNGKEVYLYKLGEALPVAARAGEDTMHLDKTTPKTEKMPKKVPKPGFFAKVGDFFMKLGGGRNETCRKYDEYTKEVDRITKANHTVEMLKGRQSERVRMDPELQKHAEFAASKAGTMVEMERRFEQLKQEYNYKAFVSGMARANSDQRTPEEEKATQIWAKVSPEENSIRLNQKVHFISNVDSLNATKAHIDNVLWSTELGKSLPFAPDRNDLFRDLGFIEKPGNKPAAEDYLKTGNAIYNILNGAHPESRTQDIAHLRGVVKGAVGFMNDELRKDGIQDNTRTIDDNSRLAVNMTMDKVFMTAQATAHLGKLLCEEQVKQGLMDVEMAELAMRADAIRTFGIDVKREAEAVKGNSVSNLSIQGHLDTVQTSRSFDLETAILRAAGPERVASATALAASVSQIQPSQAELSQQVDAFTKDSAVRALKGMGDNVKEMDAMRTLSAIVVTDQLQSLAEKNALANPERFNQDFARDLVSNAKFIEATNGKNSQQIAQDTLAGRFQAPALDQAIPEAAKRGMDQQKEMEQHAEKEMAMKAAAPKAAAPMGPHG